jgi:hypothetical protein
MPIFFHMADLYIFKRKIAYNIIITLYHFMSTMVIRVIVIKCNCVIVLKFIVLLPPTPVALTCSLYTEDCCWCES